VELDCVRLEFQATGSPLAEIFFWFAGWKKDFKINNESSTETANKSGDWFQKRTVVIEINQDPSSV
jgi:hypothetical protein